MQQIKVGDNSLFGCRGRSSDRKSLLCARSSSLNAGTDNNSINVLRDENSNKKGALRRLGSAKVQLSPRGEISGVPVSYRDNNGVYSAVQQITELRQTVGRVYQHQRRSPRLRVNASLTLHLCTAAFGGWPTVISLFPASSLIAQSPHLLSSTSAASLHHIHFSSSFLSP